MLLRFEKVSKIFNSIAALSDVSFEVDEEEVAGLIGPNGSGKTTVFNVISRLVTPDRGAVTFKGENLLPLQPHQVARKGVARISQTPQLCSALTVLENVALGAYAHPPMQSSPLWQGQITRASLRVANDYLDLVGVNGKRNDPPAALSYFEWRQVEVARALVTMPNLLLLDEPTSGFSQAEREWFAKLLHRIRDRGIAILIIEHDLLLIRQVSDRVIVLDAGRRIAEGSPDSIARDTAVAEVYLGAVNVAG